MLYALKRLTIANIAAAFGLLIVGFVSVDGAMDQHEGPPPAGNLYYVSQGDVWRLDLLTQEQRLLIDVGADRITHVVHSPDLGRLAYSVSVVTDGYRVTSSSI